jgi:hypothetical protein
VVFCSLDFVHVFSSTVHEGLASNSLQQDCSEPRNGALGRRLSIMSYFAPICMQVLSDGNARVAVVILCGLMFLLLIDGPNREPDPRAVDDMLAAGAVPALLSIMASLTKEAAVVAFELLHVIAREPRGETAVAAADFARPLITALGAAFDSPPVALNDNTARDVRADIVGMISRLVEGRPGVGDAFIAAGLLREMGNILAPARPMTERKLVLELAEKLIWHTPGACAAMEGEGIFTKIHRLTLGGPKVAAIHTSERDEEVSTMEATRALLVAEPSHARAVLCMAAGHCGGTLEVGTGDGEPVQYTADMGIPLRRATPEASPHEGPRMLEVGASPSAGPAEGGPPPSPGTPEAAPAPSARNAEAHPHPNLGTPEAAPTPDPGTTAPRAAPAIRTPEAARTPKPGTGDARPRPNHATLEAASSSSSLRMSERAPTSNSWALVDHPTPSPGTPEAAPVRVAGQRKPLHHHPGRPRAAASDSPPHPTVRRSSRRVCFMCGTVSQQKFRVCTRCRRAAYCGRDCQAAHWPVHKSECQG